MEKDDLERLICDAVGADSVTSWEPLQTLWSGYGKILRVHLTGGRRETAVVKQVSPPATAAQPRGWNTDTSHQRKLRSYEIEASWYRDWSDRLGDDLRIARCDLVHEDGDARVFVLEDLDASGFGVRIASANHDAITLGLRWLARFHCRFIHQRPTGLWETGTYWHLATRPDELDALPDADDLKQNASLIDQRLRDCTFPTIVQGDGKIANFCFADDLSDIAAVDFQYVGGGCAMKDVAYFLGSCLDERGLEEHADDLLDQYFAETKHCLPDRWLAFESECRVLYPIAWADFHRFLTGWFPQHQKLHGYSLRMTELAMRCLRKNP